MSDYNDLINCINNLQIGTRFSITQEFCEEHKLVVNVQEIKTWGRLFARDGMVKTRCEKYVTIKHPQYKGSNKSTDNLSHYIKK